MLTAQLTRRSALMLVELGYSSELAQRAREAVVNYPLPSEDTVDEIMIRLKRLNIRDPNDLRVMYATELIMLAQNNKEKIAILTERPVPYDLMAVISELG